MRTKAIICAATFAAAAVNRAVTALGATGALNIIPPVLLLVTNELTALGGTGAGIYKPATVAALRAVNVGALNDGDLAVLAGYYSDGDRGGGVFKWNASSTATDDGGAVIVPGSAPASGRWLRLLLGEKPNVKMWGATGNRAWNSSNPTDDTAAVKAAILACSFGAFSYSQAGYSAELVFPAGSYLVSDTLYFNAQGLRLTGEGRPSAVVMSNSVGKDIFVTLNASNAMQGITGQAYYDHNLQVQGLAINYLGALGANTNHACLAINLPGENNFVRNLNTTGGGYGIRCFSAGSPGLRLRDASLNNHYVGGLVIENPPGMTSSGGGPVSIVGLSGDVDDPLITNACMVKVVDSVCQLSIDNLKVEQNWGGGVVQWKWPAAASGYIAAGGMGSLTMNNVNCNASGVTPTDVVVLKGGGERTPSVSLHHFNLTGTRYLVRDEVTGRNVASDANASRGTAQMTVRLPLSYEGFTNSANPAADWVRVKSRLVIGNTELYAFTPASTGWYRAMADAGGGLIHLGGNLVITSARDSTEVQVEVSPYATTKVYFDVTRATATNSTSVPVVDKVRGFTYFDTQINGNRAAVDVHVNVAGVALTLATDLHVKSDTDSGELQLLAPTAPVSGSLPGGAASLETVVLR